MSGSVPSELIFTSTTCSEVLCLSLSQSECLNITCLCLYIHYHDISIPVKLYNYQMCGSFVFLCYIL